MSDSGFTLGLIGFGFLGTAIAYGFAQTCDIKVYDIDPKRSTNTLDEVANCDYVFICVNTPSFEDGTIDTSYVESALSNVSEHRIRDDNCIILKSTIVPDTLLEIVNKYSKLDIVYNPEFLTSRTARFDFINAARTILAGPQDKIEKVKTLYKARFHWVPIIETDYVTASMIKYMANCFFATKISFVNEMRLLCDKNGADWNTLITGVVADSRIADSHMQCPGWDGQRGYASYCFAKDVNTNTLSGGWKTNLEVRPQKDWCDLPGVISKKQVI